MRTVYIVLTTRIRKNVTSVKWFFQEKNLYSIGNGEGVFTDNTPLTPPTTVKIPNPTNDASFNIFFTLHNKIDLEIDT
jgi:hypothetical protein